MNDIDYIIAKDFMIYVDVQRENGTILLPICTATDVTIEISNDLKECTPNPNKSSAGYGWKVFAYGLSAYNVSISGAVNITSNKRLADMILGYMQKGFDSGDGIIPLGYQKKIDLDSRSTYFDIEQHLINKEVFKWKAEFEDDGNYVHYSGSVLIPSTSHQSQNGDINRFSGTLQGSGQLSVFYNYPITDLAIQYATAHYREVSSGGSYTEIAYSFTDDTLSDWYDVKVVGAITGSIYTKIIQGNSDIFVIPNLYDSYYYLYVAKRSPKKSDWVMVETAVESASIPLTNLTINSITYTGSNILIDASWLDGANGDLYAASIVTSEGVEYAQNALPSYRVLFTIPNPNYTSSDAKIWTLKVKRLSPMATDYYTLQFNIVSQLDVTSLVATNTTASLGQIKIPISFTSTGTMFKLTLKYGSDLIASQYTTTTQYTWNVGSTGMFPNGSGVYTLTVQMVQPTLSTNSTTTTLNITM